MGLTHERHPPLDHWGLAGQLQPLPGGARNPVWRCGDVVLKKSQRTEDALRWLAPVHVAARATGLRVPAPLPTQSGRLLAEGWIAEAYMPGRPATRADLRALRPILRRFHNATAALPQRPGFLSVAQAMQRPAGGDLDFYGMPRSLQQHLRQAWARVRHGRHSIVHGDLNPGNVIVTAQGPALVDWDEARRDLVLFDEIALGVTHASDAHHAATVFEIACCWRREPARARRLLSRLNSRAGSVQIP